MAFTSQGENWTEADCEQWAQSEDMSASRGCVVKLGSTAGQVTLATNDGTEFPYGIVVKESADSTAGTRVTILPCASGKRCNVRASGATTIGDTQGFTTAGESVTTTTDGDAYCGITMETGADNSRTLVKLGAGFRGRA